MYTTIMQSLVFMVSKKITTFRFLQHTDTQPAGQPNNDHYIDSILHEESQKPPAQLGCLTMKMGCSTARSSCPGQSSSPWRWALITAQSDFKSQGVQTPTTRTLSPDVHFGSSPSSLRHCSMLHNRSFIVTTRCWSFMHLSASFSNKGGSWPLDFDMALTPALPNW